VIDNSPNRHPLGPRETKKASTRLKLQAQALKLFTEKGYEHTTVAEIAKAAGVSERTYFRYFPTKPDAVLWDSFDATLIDIFRSQPPTVSTIDAFRRSMRAVFTQLTPAEVADQHQRLALMLSVPELRAGLLDQLVSSLAMLEELLEERTGRRHGNRKIRALAGAIIGVTVSALGSPADTVPAEIAPTLDRALGLLNEGFGDI
jgi:AcrR family transcriptional regulator